MQSNIPSQDSQDACRRSAWHPSRLLLVEEWVLCGAIAAVGLVYLYTWMPKPSVPAAVARSMEKLRNPFNAVPPEKPVAVVPASRTMVAAIKRAQKLEERGCFDESTLAAWKEARDEVRRMSWLPISCGQGRHVRLFLKEAEEARAVEIATLLEQLMPGQFAAVEAQRIAAVEADTLQEATTPAVTWFTVAANAPEGVRETATSLAAMHEEAVANARIIGKYRELVGYDYWRAVCQAGANEAGFQARAALWRADFVANQDQLEQAKAAYEEGFQAWQTACSAVPALGTDPHVAEDMSVHNARYRAVLAALDAASATRQPSPPTIDL